MDSVVSILSVAVPRPLDGLFTYRVPAQFLPLIKVGGWVKVPFGRSVTHAFVVKPPAPITDLPADLPADSLKDVLAVGETDSILPPDVLSLCQWAQEYYCAPLGEVLNCAVPSTLLKLPKRMKRKSDRSNDSAIKSHILTEDQVSALETLESSRQTSREGHSSVALLHGVTGSGKTEIYIELAKRTLAEGKSVILLVPEIALTSQLHQRFSQSLGVPVALWHSAVADGKRREESLALRSGAIRVVVGARSAVFAPVKQLGLIVVDEEHDPSYKQEDRVRYHARDLAIVRGKITGAFTLLGSATPSLETRQRVDEKRFALATLPKRIAAGGMPKIEIVDLCQEEKVENTQAPLATRTIEAIQDTLMAGEQAMVFLNRRGFANFIICEDCGEVRGCRQCSISLTVHRRKGQLVCHVCGYQEGIPDFCWKCDSHQMRAIGAGTESLEDELPRLFRPEVPFHALRLDRDQVTSASRLEKVLDEFRHRRANVLLGTQMLVKGHDFPGVTLVVVILADALFRWPDFRAPERAFQILHQVSGRAGRGDKPGRVLIQTYQPDHPVLQVIQNQVSEESFLANEKELRQALGYPPFGRMARLRFEAGQVDEARVHAQTAVEALRNMEQEGRVQLLGPSEAFLERAKGIYRWDVLIKAAKVQDLKRSVETVRDGCRRQRWSLQIDVDPYGVG